jgi:hypothetical protein
MSSEWPDDPIKLARYWVDVAQHTNRIEDVTKRGAGTGRVVQSLHGFNTWVEQTPEQRRETLEEHVPWAGVPEETKKEMIEEAIRTEPRPETSVILD